MFTHLGGGDVEAPGVIPGLLNKFGNHLGYIRVRFRWGVVPFYVQLNADGTAEIRYNHGVLPNHAALVQRARRIAASDETEWKEKNGKVVTVNYHTMTEDGGR